MIILAPLPIDRRCSAQSRQDEKRAGDIEWGGIMSLTETSEADPVALEGGSNNAPPPSKSDCDSNLVLLAGAPPGFRTQNLRIKRSNILVQLVLARPLSWCFIRPAVYRMVPNPSDYAQLATQLGTKIQSTGFRNGHRAQRRTKYTRFGSIQSS